MWLPPLRRDQIRQSGASVAATLYKGFANIINTACIVHVTCLANFYLEAKKSWTERGQVENLAREHTSKALIAYVRVVCKPH